MRLLNLVTCAGTGLLIRNAAALPIFGLGDKFSNYVKGAIEKGKKELGEIPGIDGTAVLEEIPGLDLGKKGVPLKDASLVNTFKLMSQYSAAAYCFKNHDNTIGDKVTCPAGNCPLVEAADTKSLAEFQDFPGTDVTGFVAVDKSNKMVVVSFRGSLSPANFATDLNFAPTATDLCAGCTAHSGFWQSWVDARPGVMAAVRNVSATYPNFKLVTTGHSLGGAIATLAAAQLRNEGKSVAMYSFGAPRVAPERLSQFISNQPGGNFRITFGQDLVPRLPPSLFKYVHISPEYFIEKNRRTSKGDVQPSDVSMLEGSTNFWGNRKFVVPILLPHVEYFGDICGCVTDQILDLKIDVEFA
ncbi:alpha/beta-hydrolase [Aaosphaeria arxii CBS 175.79]|uniref:Alpha/beta-hydrolase n=1 Tax=Aaosphaeria arxii CBS 175.79 TaxID=1450172 RepID=A0A6A5Y9P6_9PLEO|nr:alpha/beta-hydrolase [Aaosphaeria arxii CBS 175.79]KAF2021737.1 alpha/beta-hydrolase [Aaosphaeria arxii CBS 175.79]